MEIKTTQEIVDACLDFEPQEGCENCNGHLCTNDYHKRMQYEKWVRISELLERYNYLINELGIEEGNSARIVFNELSQSSDSLKEEGKPLSMLPSGVTIGTELRHSGESKSSDDRSKSSESQDIPVVDESGKRIDSTQDLCLCGHRFHTNHNQGYCLTKGCKCNLFRKVLK